MKPILIGVYQLGNTDVEVFGNTTDDVGELEFRPEPMRLPRVTIGLGCKSWPSVVSVLLHESFEFLMLQDNLSYDGVGRCGSTQNRMFIFNHGHYTDLCAQQADFLVKCLPDLARVWNKVKPKK